MPVESSELPYRLRPLAEIPDAEGLSREAERLQREYANGSRDAIGLVRRFCPSRVTDALTLDESRHVIARSYGLENWGHLQAQLEGVTRENLVRSVVNGAVVEVASMLDRRPDLVDAATGKGEQRLVHLAVMSNDEPMLRMLMERGADARRGIWPHRDATSPLQMAIDRELTSLVATINEVESHRRSEFSGNHASSDAFEALAEQIVSNRTPDAIDTIRQDRALIHQCDAQGNTPLHLACGCGNTEMVEWLVSHDADFRAANARGDTPVDCAVIGVNWKNQHRIQSARNILQRLRETAQELTPLAAAALGDCERLRAIEQESPGMLADSSRWHWLWGGPLSAAVTFDCGDAVQTLLDLGLNPDEPIELGIASDDESAVSWGGPLWRAAAFGRYEIAVRLLDGGADPNGNVYASGWPLDRAYEREDRQMVDLLYQRGAEANAWTISAAADLAAAEVFIQTNHQPAQLQELVWSAACCSALSIVEIALPKMMAVKEQLPETKRREVDWHDLLCQPMRGSHRRSEDASEDTTEGDRYKVMARLLDAGMDPRSKGNFGLTLLHFVAARGGMNDCQSLSDSDRVRFAQILLASGADPDARDELLCSTALGWACRYGRTDLVAYYIEAGVDTVEADAPRWATPLAWARKMQHTAILDMLKSQ